MWVFSCAPQLRSLTFLVIAYHDNLEKRRVKSDVQPGYLKKLLPEHPPEEGEDWGCIQNDIEAKIMPGMTHWYVSAPDLGGGEGHNLCSAADSGDSKELTKLHGVLPSSY